MWRALQNLFPGQTAQPGGPSCRGQLSLEQYSLRTPGVNQFASHGCVQLDRFEQLRLRDAFFGGVREMNAAGANQKGLAPRVVKAWNVRCESNDGSRDTVQGGKLN